MLKRIEASQAEALQAEERKLASLRSRSEARLARFKEDAQIKAQEQEQELKKQLEEKRRLQEVERKALELEAHRTQQYNKLLREQEEKEMQERRALTEGIKAEWAEQARRQHEDEMNKKMKALDFTDLPPERCGKAAMQKMDGEDVGYSARKKQQHAQMAAWVQQQLMVKQRRQEAEAQARKQEDATFRRVLARVQEEEEAESEYQSFLMRQVHAENNSKAKQQAQIKAQQLTQRLEEERKMLQVRLNTDPILNEANDYMDPETGRIVPDRFRGLSRLQRQALIHSNKTLLIEKEERKYQAAAEERAWGEQQARYAKLMEKQEAEEKKAREMLLRETKAILEEQKAEHQARTKEAHVNAFGQIEEGKSIMHKFGTSLS